MKIIIRIIVAGEDSVPENANERNKQVTPKNYAPFTDWLRVFIMSITRLE